MDKKLFASRLTEMRKKKYKTKDAFAEVYDAQYNDGSKSILATLKNYENPRNPTIPRLDIVDRICSLLDCDVDYLLGRIDYKTHDNQYIATKLLISEEAAEKIIQLPHIFENIQDGSTVRHFLYDLPTFSFDRLLCSKYLIPFLDALSNCLTAKILPTSAEQLLNYAKNIYGIDEKSVDELTKQFYNSEHDELIQREKASDITSAIFSVNRIATRIAEEFVEYPDKIIVDSMNALAKEGDNGIS